MYSLLARSSPFSNVFALGAVITIGSTVFPGSHNYASTDPPIVQASVPRCDCRREADRMTKMELIAKPDMSKADAQAFGQSIYVFCAQAGI
jgi:hypothetical protein